MSSGNYRLSRRIEEGGGEVITCERIPVTEVEKLTGLQRCTLYKLMDLGVADLGTIIPGQKKTYVFFRPKVERFVQGGSDISQYTELVSSIKMMNYLLTNAILTLPEGEAILKGVNHD